ncbi:MAG: nucleoside triphosphate pyrophosphohydrolase, partial [Pelagibacterales bacterium]|nr:nucleoside triphosphate pyrophosphohydrolase [Pelagibacterales bacterium]
TKQKLSDKELKAQWKRIKIEEGKSNNRENPFQNLKKSQPALLEALDITLISKDLKFDWDNYKGPVNKIKEELNEVIEEKESINSDPIKIEEEIGDLLFSVVNLSRHLNINPEIALLNANKKFISRFKLMLQQFESKEKFTHSNSKLKEKAWKNIKKL